MDTSSAPVPPSDVAPIVRGARRRVALRGVAAVLVAVATLWATAAGAQVRVSRLQGADRYATAVAVSSAYFSPPINAVFVATGETFPDALAATPIASNEQGAPMLLVTANSVPASTAAELTRLDPLVIFVIGGPAAVSDAVVTQLRQFGDVVRVAGADRYDTAAEVSRLFTPPAPVPEVFIATGETFPDALAGGAAASALDGPILLVTQSSIPAPTVAALNRLRPQRITVFGGTSAVSEAVFAQLGAFSQNVRRLSGPTRYATAAAVSADVFAPGVDEVFLATGVNFPDALAGGPAAGALGAPVLLVQTDCVPAEVLAEIDRLDPAQVTILGGPSAVGPGVAAFTRC